MLNYDQKKDLNISETLSIKCVQRLEEKNSCVIFPNLLSGTPRATQKCFRSNLRVEFSGENHLFLICGKMPNQTLQLTKYLDSGRNSDQFKKKNSKSVH